MDYCDLPPATEPEQTSISAVNICDGQDSVYVSHPYIL
jgi:hypothetical protein